MAAGGSDPRIVAFVCTWHPLTAADNAGADGCRYAPGTTIVPLECVGSVSTAAILHAFASRADGVLVAGCGAGDCHYANGNEACESVVEEARAIMALSGLPPERLKLDLSSDVDGQRFADLVTGFADELTRLGSPAGRKRKAARARTGKGRTPSGVRTKAKRKAGSAAAKGGHKAAGPALRKRKARSAAAKAGRKAAPAAPTRSRGSTSRKRRTGRSTSSRGKKTGGRRASRR